MKDPYGREITNIRISLTQECNLNCFYCHEEGEKGLEKGELSAKNVNKIVRKASKIGMNKVKFTGGEPLVHPDIVDIIESADEYMDDVSITTNGVLLEDLSEGLKDAGLDRANVSIDTLDHKTYKKITGKNSLDKVKKGVKKAVNVGLFPVKINTLLMKYINENEIEDLIEFSSKTGAILQIIEFTTNEEEVSKEFYKKYHVSLEKIADDLEKRAVDVKERRMHGRKKYFLDDPKAEVELVRTMHNTTFCSNCTRLRVTSNAELKPCLLRTDNHVSIREELDKGLDLEEKFVEAINRREPYWSD